MNKKNWKKSQSVDLSALLKGSRDHQFDSLLKSGQAQVMLGTLPPGHSSSRLPTVHQHSDHIIYLIEGEARMRVERDTHDLCGGALLLIPAGQLHQVINTGSRRLIYLGFLTPPAY